MATTTARHTSKRALRWELTSTLSGPPIHGDSSLYAGRTGPDVAGSDFDHDDGTMHGTGPLANLLCMRPRQWWVATGHTLGGHLN